MHELKFAVVCSSNQNRSMEAHALLNKKGFNVCSFGCGSQVKLPGASPDQPNVYDFSTSYEEMYQDLHSKNKTFYTQNGILRMLDRNKRIKSHPEKFQLCQDVFDVIFTLEERVYDQVIEELSSRSPKKNTPVHVVNIDVRDTYQDAALGALSVCEMATRMAECDDLDSNIDDLLQDFELKAQRPILHTMHFYSHMYNYSQTNYLQFCSGLGLV